MNVAQAVVLGVVEGVTEFLPVSSTGHLTIAESLMGIKTDDKAVTAFTAVIQVGAILAAVFYFRRDIARLVVAFFRGLGSAQARQETDWRLALCVIAGSIPIGVVGFLAKDFIKSDLRSLWVVAGALIVWSAVMVVAERVATYRRHEEDTTLKDAIIIGLVQCLALVPGVSRSGATISAGLFRGLDRVTATRLSFLLGIPALVAAGGYELKDLSGIDVTPTVVATVVSFVVAYISIAWLLKFVVRHSIAVFAAYRVLLAVVIIGLLATNVISAT
ncbi:MAG: undecaprenyl-diphosphate phosphatase [Actinomycetota bacterium]|nr:undecaprenyl-diphosphate phosphatase [Actinomycetota bacterium]